ncbi:MAG: hypothetical protein LUE91_02435, partial [Oscillospiraceae bacterium]|nr:hypothetical protein [Oscillospiraceae bacterium]
TCCILSDSVAFTLKIDPAGETGHPAARAGRVLPAPGRWKNRGSLFDLTIFRQRTLGGLYEVYEKNDTLLLKK